MLRLSCSILLQVRCCGTTSANFTFTAGSNSSSTKRQLVSVAIKGSAALRRFVVHARPAKRNHTLLRPFAAAATTVAAAHHADGVVPTLVRVARFVQLWRRPLPRHGIKRVDSSNVVVGVVAAADHQDLVVERSRSVE